MNWLEKNEDYLEKLYTVNITWEMLTALPKEKFEALTNPEVTRNAVALFCNMGLQWSDITSEVVAPDNLKLILTFPYGLSYLVEKHEISWRELLSLSNEMLVKVESAFSKISGLIESSAISTLSELLSPELIKHFDWIIANSDSIEVFNEKELLSFQELVQHPKRDFILKHSVRLEEISQDMPISQFLTLPDNTQILMIYRSDVEEKSVEFYTNTYTGEQYPSSRWPTRSQVELKTSAENHSLCLNKTTQRNLLIAGVGLTAAGGGIWLLMATGVITGAAFVAIAWPAAIAATALGACLLVEVGIYRCFFSNNDSSLNKPYQAMESGQK